MQLQTLTLLLNHFEDKKLDEKKSYLDLAMLIFECNLNIQKFGLNSIKNILKKTGKYNLFQIGISLVEDGTDPNIVEYVLLNHAIHSNEITLLNALLSIEGILLIQKNENILVTKEVIKSFFGIGYINVIESKFNEILQKNNFPIKSNLTEMEIHNLIQNTDN